MIEFSARSMPMSVLIRDVKCSGVPMLLSRTPALATKEKDLRQGFARDEAQAELSIRKPTAETVREPIEPRMTRAEFEAELGESLDRLTQEARERGLTEGRKRGHDEVRKDHAAQLQSLKEFIRGAQVKLAEDIEGLTDVGIEIVLQAIVRIVGNVAADPEGGAMIVREVIKEAKDRSRLLVRVRPADFAFLAQHGEKLLEGLNAGKVEFVADDRVALGGCILETPIGDLDGRLESQLTSLTSVLRSARTG
jgi:flagellar assembly protein FliH